MSEYVTGPRFTIPAYNGSGGVIAKHRFVVLAAAADEAVDFPAAGGGVHGVTYDDIADGDWGSMEVGPEPVLLEVDDAVTRGDALATDATGVGTAAVATDYVAATALESIGAAGLIRVLPHFGNKIAA